MDLDKMDRQAYLEHFENEFFELFDEQVDNIIYYVDVVKKKTTAFLEKIIDLLYEECCDVKIDNIKDEDGSYSNYIIKWNNGYPYIKKVDE